MGRSLLISITSTTSPCRTSCNMTKALIFVLLGLVAMALSENLGEDQGYEIEETLDEIELESLDASRMKRDADPRKKKKHKGKKPRKAGRKGKKGGKKPRKFGRKNKKARKQRKQVKRGKKP